MQPLTATLEAAQRQHGAVASVRLTVRDVNLRWQAFLEPHSSEAQTAAATSYACIVRARNLYGAIHVQRITDPSQAAQWQAWTLLCTTAHPNSDIALSATQTGERLRLFFCEESGGVYSVACYESADSGQTWVAAADVVGGMAALGPLGSANGNLLYHDPGDGYVKLARAPWGGAWTTDVWTAGGALATRLGIAAAHEAPMYYVATCDEEAADTRRLRTGTFDGSTGVWSSPVAVVPPGVPSAGFAPRWPSVVNLGGLWVVGYTETYSDASLSYDLPTVIYSADWEHWSGGTRVQLQAVGAPLRAHLVGLDSMVFMALERDVWRARDYSAGDPAKHLEEDGVASYRIVEQPFDGEATIEVDNSMGRYDQPTTGLPLQPLAQAVVERGYVTAAGVERVARTPYYIMSVGVRRGGKSPTLRLECVDGWHLLGLWHPESLYLQTDRSIGWLIADIVYRATGQAVTTDGYATWSMVLPAIVVGPDEWTATLHEPLAVSVAEQLRSAERMGTNGLSVVRALLAKAGGAGYWRADGSLHCFTPVAQGGGPGSYYTVQEADIIDALYTRDLLAPTEAWVFGDGVVGWGLAYSTERVRRFPATRVDMHIRDAYLAQISAGAIAYSGRAGRVKGWIELPVPCGAELYDFLYLHDSRAGELNGSYFRVTRIAEVYEPRKGRLQARLTVEEA